MRMPSKDRDLLILEALKKYNGKTVRCEEFMVCCGYSLRTSFDDIFRTNRMKWVKEKSYKFIRVKGIKFIKIVKEVKNEL